MTRPQRIKLFLWLVISAGAIAFILYLVTRTPQPPAQEAELFAPPAVTYQPVATSLAPASTPLPTTELNSGEPPSLQPVAFDTPTPPAGGAVLDVRPHPNRVGWVSQAPDGSVSASFPDFNIYAGTLNGVTYLGLIGFDLAGQEQAPIAEAAELVLFGLTGENQRLADGEWTVEMLADDAGLWEDLSPQRLEERPDTLLLAVLTPEDLAPKRVVRIPLPPEALTRYNAAVYQRRSLTFLIRGPAQEASLFGFDGGIGAGSLGNGPRLLVVTGPPQPTPAPIVVTATPTPVNVLTAAAQVALATAQAQTTGTATPTPFNMVTATPAGQGGASVTYWIDPAGTPVPVVVPTQPPENPATRIVQVLEATAIAQTTGTPTPLPERYVTATPTATPVILVATTTPENVVTLAARLVAATARAQSYGPATPLPPNVRIITPTPRFLVVTSTPRPANVATAQVLAAQATVQFILTGSPTPTPVNQVTATPLPLLIPVSYFTPTPTPIPTSPIPQAVPGALHGKILFLSDRTGEPLVYALDPATGLVYSVTETWPYALLQDRLGLSPDGKRQAIVAPDGNRNLQIQIHSLEFGDTRQVTAFNATSYDPAWSPTGELIAFVSTDPGNDEIYTVTPDGSTLTRLTFNSWEWDKHPSWSPDGRQIVFWSNRETGRRQLWIMDADGGNQRNLSSNEFNDWDPIWVP